MQVVIEDLMKMAEFTDVQYFSVAILILLGVLIIWRLWK